LKKISSYFFFILFLLPCPASGFRNHVCDIVSHRQDTLVLPDASLSAVADSLSPTADSLSVQRERSLEDPVFSDAKDSIIYDFTGAERMIYYYGDVKVKSGDTEITADYMAYDFETRIVFASGRPDSTGKLAGTPVMKESGKDYAMQTMYYNFSSGKARINDVITQEGDAYLHGTVIKKMPDNAINVAGGKYTVCEAPHPHFYLKLSRARITPEPNSQTVFGPAYLVIEDVPTPLFLPFGFIPKRNDRSGGFLFPSFGEETARGFYLTGIGWYFVFGEYFDLALTADYFTLGTYGFQAASRYKKMYKFDGSFNLQWRNNVSGLQGSSDYDPRREFSINWRHQQDQKANPNMSFGASVSFMTSSYRRNNSQTNPQMALQSSAQSSISFRKSWEGSPFNLSVNLTHSQNMQDSSYDLTLPNFTLTMNTIYPFKRKNAVGKERFYERFALGYITTFDNKISFKESEWGSPDFWSKLENGMKHNFNIQLPSFNILSHIQLAPSVTYGMTMFFQNITRTYNDSTKRVEDIKSNAFSNLYLSHDLSFGISASTRLYGTFVFGRNAFIQAFRHMISPSISASFRPDLVTWGWNRGYTTYRQDSSDVEYYSYAGVYPASGRGRSAGLSFSLSNNLEMKIRNKKDTVNGGASKVKLIDNLSLSSSYNFLADSMKLSNISMSLNTNIAGKVAVNANASFDPYAVDINRGGSRIGKYAVSAGQGLARLISFGFSFGYQFKGGENGFKNKAPSLDGIQHYHPETGEYLYTEYQFYQDFKAPWSLGFNYSFNYNTNYTQNALGIGIKQNNYVQSLGLNGQVKLTEAMNVSVASGFDFKNLKLTMTTFNIHYDLHCFEFAVSWTPFGSYRSWNFHFNAKSSMLADLLKYEKHASYVY
jgi:hypothetical protein